MGRRYKLYILLALICILAYMGVIAFNTQVSYAATPQQLKAVFIVNFVKLTEWPSNVAIFEVGVYKDPEFATLLTAMLAGKKVRGKDVKVTLQDDASLFANCHVIFLPKSVEGELGDVFGKIKDLGDTPANPAKLTIGETDSFIKAGGIITFVETAGAKIKFKVNLVPAKAKGLTISSKLLKLALEVVKQ